MTELENAIQEHMAFIVFSEGRPFTFRDFLQFKVGEKEYRISHGTFRNKILALKKAGVVELDFNSGIAFFTLKGHRFGKAVTPNHTVVHNDPVYKMLQEIPFDKQSIHDIHLSFNVANIWQIFSVNPNFHRNKRSQDITIPTWNKNNALLRTLIHKTNTVSVTIACSLEPISLDPSGIINLFNLLVRVEEKLQFFLDNSSLVNHNKKYISIPEYKEWVVTMWHFGRDASVEYSGERFCISVENLQDILTRIYVKDFNGKNRIRIERQEYPRMPVADAIEQKLNCKFEF